MKKINFLLLLVLSYLVRLVHCYGGIGFNPLKEFIHSQRSKHQHSTNDVNSAAVKNYSSLYKGPQDGLKAADKIHALPGQPTGVEFDQYSGYVTVDPEAGRALFYYFVESQNPSGKPLVLWLNGGPGCSSLGAGALMELGPFRVNRDSTTLSANEYAWNNVANIIFLESPAGVGCSYSNTTSDYDSSGDEQTALDSYVFLLNWLERFPEYKARDFFITGESYAGHYVPQLAQLILLLNEATNDIINLRGIAMGNPLIDSDTQISGEIEFYWSHALISDEAYGGIISTCNFSSEETISEACNKYLEQVDLGNIDLYNIYGPLCNYNSPSSGAFTVSEFDPCSSDYVSSYLNIPEVQKSLHANLTCLPGPWTQCSGDTDGVIPVTTTRSVIDYEIKTSVQTPWYPWYTQDEVGGFAVGYKNLAFVTVRGSGHFVPSYQPARALTFFSSFLNGQLPPPSPY